MKRNSIVVRLNDADKAKVHVKDKGSLISKLRFMKNNGRLNHGVGQMLHQLALRGLYPSETAVDLAVLAATVTAADTRISRAENAQDSWSREIDLYIPVADPDLWSSNVTLIARILKFLTGDYWDIVFRPRQRGIKSLVEKPPELFATDFDSVCLFSGGLDSFVGVIDLLHDKRNPILVSHYQDTSTKSQEVCADRISKTYGEVNPRHVRANVSFDKNDLPELGVEKTTRGRSFIFFGLACLAASALDGETPVHIPENGLISLNIPLDPLRLGAWSTRTTHPFYMALWQELVDNLGIGARLVNPYRFNTKGEMLAQCKNRKFVRTNLDITISCSSVTKGRWKKQPPGHCGYCTPCLIRRASIQAAFGNDSTTYSIPDLTAKPLNAKQAEARDVRAFQIMSQRLAQRPELANIYVHKTGPLNDYSISEIESYTDVLRRGIKEVGAIVDNVKIERL